MNNFYRKIIWLIVLTALILFIFMIKIFPKCSLDFGLNKVCTNQKLTLIEYIKHQTNNDIQF